MKKDMNCNNNENEIFAQIEALLDEERYEEAISVCTEQADSACDTEAEIAARLLLSRCYMAAGDPCKAVNEHRQAMFFTVYMPASELLGIADEAMRAQMPLDYCDELFFKAAKRFEDEGDLYMAASAFNKSGICVFRMNYSIEDEEQRFRRALSVIDRAPPDDGTQKQDILRALIQSNLAECLMRKDDSDEAIALYNEASEVFLRHLDTDGDMCLIHYAISQRCLSDLYRRTDQNLSAHTCLSRSITELNRRMDRLSDQLRMHLAVCYNARGTLRFQMGNYEGEIDDCTMSLQLRDGLNDDPSSLATVHSNRAEAYAMLDRYDSAKQDFARSAELFDLVPDNGQAAASAAMKYYSIGLVCDDQELYTDACDAYRTAAERIAALRTSGAAAGEYSTEHLTEIESICRARLGMSLSHLSERDYFDALTENNEAVRLLGKLPPSVDRCARLASLHLSSGELLELFDEREAARAEYELADACRSEGVRLLMSGAQPDEGEEYPENELDNEGNIWADFSDSTPQA